jgi:antitoxin component YwqK of YwqJK toxin-antitoxin module
MKYSKLSNKSFGSTIKHLLLMAFAILTIGCGEKKSDGVNAHESESVDIESDGVNLDELEFREGVAYLKNSDSPYTGKCFDFHENGQKETEMTFKGGKMDGPAVWWYENGQKETEGNYKDGKIDGLSVLWHENGQKKSEVNRKDGKPHGIVFNWYENGQKEAEGNHKDGKMDGLVVSWHENGRKMMETNYKDNELISGKFWNSKGEEVDSLEEADQ